MPDYATPRTASYSKAPPIPPRETKPNGLGTSKYNAHSIRPSAATQSLNASSSGTVTLQIPREELHQRTAHLVLRQPDVATTLKNPINQLYRELVNNVELKKKSEVHKEVKAFTNQALLFKNDQAKDASQLRYLIEAGTRLIQNVSDQATKSALHDLVVALDNISPDHSSLLNPSPNAQSPAEALRKLINETGLISAQLIAEAQNNGQKTEFFQKTLQELKEKERQYQTQFHHQTTDFFDNWKKIAISLLSDSNKITVSFLESHYKLLTAKTEEFSLFYKEEDSPLNHDLAKRINNAITNVRQEERLAKLNKWLNDGVDITPNMLNNSDDQQLYHLHTNLLRSLESHHLILNSLDKNDPQRIQAQQATDTYFRQLSQVIGLFQNVAIRYDRLKSDPQYTHQLEEMKCAERRMKHLILNEKDPATQQRLTQMHNMHNSSVDQYTLLAMNDADFRATFKILTGKNLDEMDQKTLAKNGWFLTKKGQLMLQKGHERIAVVHCGHTNQLILKDPVSGAVLAFTNQRQLDRIYTKHNLTSVQQIKLSMFVEDQTSAFREKLYGHHSRKDDGGQTAKRN